MCRAVPFPDRLVRIGALGKSTTEVCRSARSLLCPWRRERRRFPREAHSSSPDLSSHPRRVHADNVRGHGCRVRRAIDTEFKRGRRTRCREWSLERLEWQRDGGFERHYDWCIDRLERQWHRRFERQCDGGFERRRGRRHRGLLLTGLRIPIWVWVRERRRGRGQLKRVRMPLPRYLIRPVGRRRARAG